MKNNETLYSQLINSLKEEIKTMDEGDKIPSERQLCHIYNVSRTTVRNAITELEYSGHLQRIQGKGTFVNNPNKEKLNLSKYYSFTESTKQAGKTPKTVIIEYHIQKSVEKTQFFLNTDPNDLIIEFTRLRLANNEPMLLETTYLRYEDFPEITKALLEKIPLYEIFESKYDRKITKVTETFSGTFLNQEKSHFLGVRPNSACMKIIRCSYDKNNNIIEYTESYAPSDKFEYETTYFPN